MRRKYCNDRCRYLAFDARNPRIRAAEKLAVA